MKIDKQDFNTAILLVKKLIADSPARTLLFNDLRSQNSYKKWIRKMERKYGKVKVEQC